MGREDDELKRQHELAVAEGFAHYLRHHGLELGRARPGDPEHREPDVVYSSPDGTIGVEVAGAYTDEEEARLLWGTARRELEPGVRFRSLVGPDASLAAALNATLARHAALVDERDAPELIRALEVPPGHGLLDVYLILGEWGTGWPTYHRVAGEPSV